MKELRRSGLRNERGYHKQHPCNTILLRENEEQSRWYLRVSVDIPRPTDVILLLVDDEVQVLHILTEPRQVLAFIYQIDEGAYLPNRREYTTHASTDGDNLDGPVVIDSEVAELEVGAMLYVDVSRVRDEAALGVVEKLGEDVRRHAEVES